MSSQNNNHAHNPQDAASRSPPVAEDEPENDTETQDSFPAHAKAFTAAEKRHPDELKASYDEHDPGPLDSRSAAVTRTNLPATAQKGFEAQLSYINQMDISEAELLPFWDSFTNFQTTACSDVTEAVQAPSENRFSTLTSECGDFLTRFSNGDADEPMCDEIPSSITTSTMSLAEQLQLDFRFPTTYHNWSFPQASWNPGIHSYPRLDASSDEIVILRFNQETCGIMSIRHDPTQNPWRRLIWPMVYQSPALFHAIASMACFHLSSSQPELRQPGIFHVNQSMAYLRDSLDTVSTEVALTVCLALAFTESWDRHTTTGIDHIKGAKYLIAKALSDDNFLRTRSRDQRERLAFLCKTWIYVDVIARLTSVDDDVSNDFDYVASKIYSPLVEEVHVDPLMGCASTLFPTIGRVANLVRRVCKKPCSSLAMISQGVELKKQLEEWVPPSSFDRSLNTTSEILDSLRTAEAYRKATLLYLHQAIPEIQDFPTPAQLGRDILRHLAEVPLPSGTVIVHIYPLLAAGCEAATAEDRLWVQSRWEAMAQRMAIGNIDRCADVVKEVWRRRDESVSPSLTFEDLSPGAFRSRHDSLMASPEEDAEFGCIGAQTGAKDGAIDPSLLKLDAGAGRGRLPPPRPGGLEYEYTVRGRLHWVGVMKDWGWEVLLG